MMTRYLPRHFFECPTPHLDAAFCKDDASYATDLENRGYTQVIEATSLEARDGIVDVWLDLCDTEPGSKPHLPED